jgi:hypothetical protein
MKEVDYIYCRNFIYYYYYLLPNLILKKKKKNSTPKRGTKEVRIYMKVQGSVNCQVSDVQLSQVLRAG